MAMRDEVEEFARRVARAPRDLAGLIGLIRAVERETGRKVVEVEAPDAGLAERLVMAGMRLQGLHDQWSEADGRVLLFPDNVRGLLSDPEGKGLRVNWSELAMHSRCAGAEIVAWAAAAWRRGSGYGSPNVAAAWLDRERRTAGVLEGLGTEVLPLALERLTMSYMPEIR